MIEVSRYDMQEFWKVVCQKLQNRLSKPMYDTWISSTVGEIAVDNTLIVKVASEYAKKWIMKRYKHYFIEVLKELTGQDFKVQIIYNQTEADTREVSYTPIAKKELAPNLDINKVKRKRVSIEIPNITPSNHEIRLRQENDRIIRSLRC